MSAMGFVASFCVDVALGPAAETPRAAAVVVGDDDDSDR